MFERYRRVFGVSNILVLLTTLIPYTYYILRSLFGPDLLETIQQDYVWFFGFFLLHGCIYLVEVCSRLIFFNTGWMLLFHHTLWVVLIFVAAATRSVFMVKVDLILDGFVNYEFGLFVATFLRRTGASLVWRKRSIVWGCALFAVTRVLQLLVLFYLFIHYWLRETNGAAPSSLHGPESPSLEPDASRSHRPHPSSLHPCRG